MAILSKDGNFVLQPDGSVYQISKSGWVRRKDIEILNQRRAAKLRAEKHALNKQA